VTCDRSAVFPGAPVSSTNKTDRHDKNTFRILLKVALNTVTLPYFFLQNAYAYARFYCHKKKQLVKRKTDLTVHSCMLKYVVGMFFFAECLHAWEYLKEKLE
jgi:hypothetical protein